MIGLLANILTEDNPGLRKLTRLYKRQWSPDPGALVWVVGVLAAVLIAILLWRLRARRASSPNSTALLKQGAEMLGLQPRQRRLVRRLAQSAGREPVAALACPSMLSEWVRAGEQSGWTLTAAERAEAERICRIVSAAAERSGA